MPRSPAARRLVAVLGVGGCALVAGCPSGSLNDSPGRSPAGPGALGRLRLPRRPDRVAARELCGPGPRDPGVHRHRVRRGGAPRGKRPVKWMLEGPGSIIEVNESGDLGDRGAKVDNKSAVSHTESAEHRVGRGRDEFTVGPGQTWCLVTSAVEGETTMTAYCPAINDWEKSRAYAKVTWVEGDLRFPAPVTARAGGDCTLNTSVQRPGDRPAGYRVRYRIVDGPAAALTSGPDGEVDSVTEAVAPVEDDGTGRVRISQPLPAAGTNRIAIEVVKPDPDHPGRFTVVSKGETRVTWEAPKLNVSVTAPRSSRPQPGRHRRLHGRRVGPNGRPAGDADGPHPAGDGPRRHRAEGGRGRRHAYLDACGNGGKPQSVTAVVRPVRLGAPTLTAEARPEDGVTGRALARCRSREAKLLLKIEGPTAGVVGEASPFRYGDERRRRPGRPYPRPGPARRRPGMAGKTRPWTRRSPHSVPGHSKRSP